jgi:hypothetical protein
MNEEFLEMKEYNDSNSDMPDGAFFAMAEEMHGWDAYDWAWFAEECEKGGTYKQKSPKGKSHRVTKGHGS